MCYPFLASSTGPCLVFLSRIVSFNYYSPVKVVCMQCSLQVINLDEMVNTQASLLHTSLHACPTTIQSYIIIL